MTVGALLDAADGLSLAHRETTGIIGLHMPTGSLRGYPMTEPLRFIPVTMARLLLKQAAQAQQKMGGTAMHLIGLRDVALQVGIGKTFPRRERRHQQDQKATCLDHAATGGEPIGMQPGIAVKNDSTIFVSQQLLSLRDGHRLTSLRSKP